MDAVRYTAINVSAIIEKQAIAALVGEMVSASFPPKIFPKNIPSPTKTIMRGTRSSARFPTLVTIGEIYDIHENNPPVPIEITAIINQALVCLKYESC